MVKGSYEEKIVNILQSTDIYACYIFGSYGTDAFTEESDIDIAVLGDISFSDLLSIATKLEEDLGRTVDLVNLKDVYPIIQLQAVRRNSLLFCKDDDRLMDFIDKVNNWYYEEFPFWKVCMEERGVVFD